MTMTKTEIQDQLTKEVSKRFNIDPKKINDKLNFITDVDADSIDFVELVLELESTYDLEISDEQAAELKTFGQTVDFIYNNQK